MVRANPTPATSGAGNGDRRFFAPLSPAKRRVFRLLAAALPFLILGAVEGGLRLAGRGGYPPFLREAGRLPTGETLCLVEPAASKPYFFANPDRPGYAEQTNFRMPKPAGTVRIFLAGESAAKGYPQPRNLSMAAFLQEMLQAAWPGREVEVIALGTTAVASFPLVYQVRDALRFDPDLFIFYVGNNEFFGAYGTGSLDAAGTFSPRVLRVLRALRGAALFQTLNEALRRKSDDSQTLMEQMIGRAAIPADSPLRAAAARNLEENLVAMLAQTEAADVPAIVCTTASNEADLAPLGAEDAEAGGDARQAEARRLLAEGEALLARDPAGAARLFQAATEQAPRQARARFLLGRARAAAGDRAGARAAFLAARDLDTLPWRPTSQTEEAIRSAARRGGAPLCDLAERFRRDAENAWFVRVNHIKHYGTDPSLERLCVQPPGPLLFLNIDTVTDSTALIWEHTQDSPGVPCPNPRVVIPRAYVPNVVDAETRVHVRSFGIRTPPRTRAAPTYGIVGMFHILPPALAWLWRLVAPRGHDNPSITRTEGMVSEGVGSYWPFATGRRTTQANLLLQQILETPRIRYKLCPNQHIGAWKTGFMPQWIMREYLARRGHARFRDDQLLAARCPLLGWAPREIQVEGQHIEKFFFHVEAQPEIGEAAYDQGAQQLADFFKSELAQYLEPDLDPLGRRIIDCCLQNGSVEDFSGLIVDPNAGRHEFLVAEGVE